jgi:hypothetical protein
MSRRALILANVGSRDVRYTGEDLDGHADESRELTPRRMGAFLLRECENAKDDIDLPILGKGIGHIESLSYKYPEVLQRGNDAPTVGLFCTDQEDERYRESDTIEFAKVVQTKLPQMFPNSKDNKGIRLSDKRSATILPIGEHDPSRYDDMYSFYAGFFAEKARDWIPLEWRCFVLTSGGTPAMNAALILQAVRHFGENCVQIHVPREDEASELRIGEEMVRAETERRFDEALETLQFRAAARILAETSREDYRAHACRYAADRLAFDFRGAVDHCRAAIRAAQGDVRKSLERHERLTVRLAQGRPEWANRHMFIEELFYNLEVKAQLNEYVDMLGRVFRLQEALLGWIVRSEIGIESDEDRVVEEKEVERVPGLWEYMAEKLPSGTRINRRSLTVISGYLLKPAAGLPDERREKISKVRSAANKIDKLSNLRNKTIVAHGFEGVSEREVMQTWGSDTLVEDLRSTVAEALDRDLSENPFFELAERLRF